MTLYAFIGFCIKLQPQTGQSTYADLCLPPKAHNHQNLDYGAMEMGTMQAYREMFFLETLGTGMYMEVTT